jgi:hypothetical protein
VQWADDKWLDEASGGALEFSKLWSRYVDADVRLWRLARTKSASREAEEHPQPSLLGTNCCEDPLLLLW